jgi:hypothetical protein
MEHPKSLARTVKRHTLYSTRVLSKLSSPPKQPVNVLSVVVHIGLKLDVCALFTYLRQINFRLVFSGYFDRETGAAFLSAASESTYKTALTGMKLHHPEDEDGIFVRNVTLFLPD